MAIIGIFSYFVWGLFVGSIFTYIFYQYRKGKNAKKDYELDKRVRRGYGKK